MYYAKELFVKRGPLSTLWLAGSLLKKVTKAAILQADVEQLCSVVSAPPVALALPAQSTLLRGVVRIENKKALYLLEDCEHTTGRLTQPRGPREQTTLDARKLKAASGNRTRAQQEGKEPDSTEKITYTDADQAMLDEERFALGELDEVGMLVDATGEFALFDAEESERRLSAADLSVARGSAEDITFGSQDLGQIAMEGMDEFDSLDMQIGQDDYGELGAGLMEPELGAELGLPIPPSPAISELAGVELDLESLAMPKRAKGKKRPRAFLPVIDDQTEMGDDVLRRQLFELGDLVIARPVPKAICRREDELEVALEQPASVNPADHAYVPGELMVAMQHECRVEPVVDIAGHTPAEVEMEFGGELGWDMEEGGFAGDISEGRERDFEIEVAGVDESLVLSMQQAEEEAAVSGLFGEISQREIRPPRVSRPPIEVVSEMETPEFGVPESQFELPHKEVAVEARLPRVTIERRAVSKHTEIFRSALENKFGRLARHKQELSIEFDAFLVELMSGPPSRRDRALAFYQLLVLVSLEIIHITQPDSFGEITITKGVKYAVRWSSSQMFGSGTPSQSY